jgi:hypothetical protein
MDQNIKQQQMIITPKCDDFSDEEECGDDEVNDDAGFYNICETRECGPDIATDLAAVIDVPTTEASSTQPAVPEPAPFTGVKTVEFAVTDADPNKKLVIDSMKIRFGWLVVHFLFSSSSPSSSSSSYCLTPSRINVFGGRGA